MIYIMKCVWTSMQFHLTEEAPKLGVVELNVTAKPWKSQCVMRDKV